MSKKSRNSCVCLSPGISPVLLVGGGLFLFGSPVCRAAALDGLDLIPSQQLAVADGRAQAGGVTPLFRAENGPELLLLASLDLSGGRRPYTDSPGEPSEISLRLTQALGSKLVPGKLPRFAASSEPPLELQTSPRMEAVALSAFPVSSPEPPARRQEFPLRLAQVMVPRINAARQPRWGTSSDIPLDLRLSPGMAVPRQAGDLPDMPAGVRPRVAAPEAPLGASSDLAGDDAPVVFEGGSRRDSAASQPAAESPASESSGIGGWRIPPIRWAGTTGYNLRRTSTSAGEGGGSTTTNLTQNVMANLRASSYIYAPWFAQVNGNLGLSTGSSSTSGEQGQQSKTTSVTGAGEFALFPASRFPFNASVSRSDSRTGDSVTAMEYTDTRFGFRQGYRSEDGLQNAYASLDHSTVDSLGQPSNTVTALQGSYGMPLNTRVGAINNNLAGRYSVSQSGAGGNGATLMGFNSSHSWNDSDNMSLNAYTGYTDNTMRYASNGATGETRGRYMQLGASGSWRPWFDDDDEQPLTLSGGVSYFNASTESNGLSSQSQRMTGNVSSHYRYSNNLSMTGAGSLTYMTTPGGTQGNRGLLLPTVTGGINYTGNPLTFGNFSYNWNAGGSAGWQGAAGEVPSNVYYGGSLGHSLGRNYLISRTDSVSVNFSQSLSATQNQLTGMSSSLSNNAMTNYRLALGTQFSGTVSATLSDTMTSGINSQHYDSFNLSLSGFGQLSPRSSASTNLAFIWTSQKSDTTFSNGFSQQTSVQRMSMLGSATYSHMRFAGVPGLRYTFLFNADTTLRDERMLGNVNGSAQRARYGVDNHLDYRIGRLDTRFTASMNESGGKKNALLFFQVTRQIGAY